MNIHLIANGNKYPNIALMKLSTYHKGLGDDVTLTTKRRAPLRRMDKGYVSLPFTMYRKEIEEMIATFPYPVTCGGTGFSMDNLPEEVTRCALDYSIYPKIDYAIDFMSRGCIRKCPWCVVPGKEGKLQYIQSAREIVKDRKKVMFLDNNFTALPYDIIEENLTYLAENRIETCFTQGLDFRLITLDMAILLRKMKWRQSRIIVALDSISQIDSFRRFLEIAKEANIVPTRLRVLCLIGFEGIESDIERLWFLHEEGVQLFPMKFRDYNNNEPALGWEKDKYKKFTRLICRVPYSKPLWEDFNQQLRGG